MVLLLVLVVWSVSLLLLLCLCRAAHLEDAARGFVEEPWPAPPVTGPVAPVHVLARAAVSR